MSEFGGFLRTLGLQPRGVAADGKWRRCPTDNHPKKKNGAYKLCVDGRTGFAQDWAIHESAVVWHADGEQPDGFDVRKVREANRVARLESQRATVAAREFYASCEPLRGGHPYLEAHGLDMAGCHGLRVDGMGWLVVPSYRGRSVQTVQRIAPDGDKRFWPGASVSGSSYTVWRRDATVTVYCEGLATGLACFAALRESSAVVAWNAGNLARLSPRGHGLAVVAADNDHETAERIGSNPGREAAARLAESLHCGVAYPVGIVGTDWADYRLERFELLRQSAGKYDTDRTVQKRVDAEVARQLMREARFV